MAGGVYAIEQIDTGCRYIGSTKGFAKRWGFHRWMLRAGRHHSPRLQNAWSKHGEAAFRFCPLLRCADKDLLFYEQRCLDGFNTYRAGFNARPDVSTGRGLPLSDETKKKIGAANKGRERSPETRALISAARRGKPLSAAARGAHATKLDATEARALRWAAKTRGYSGRMLGMLYDLSPAMVSMILSNQRWAVS